MSSLKNKPAGENEKTFVVRVTDARSSGWRGNIVCVEERRQQQFSSVQELMGLMGSVLCTENNDGGNIK